VCKGGRYSTRYSGESTGIHRFAHHMPTIIFPSVMCFVIHVIVGPSAYKSPEVTAPCEITPPEQIVISRSNLHQIRRCPPAQPLASPQVTHLPRCIPVTLAIPGGSTIPGATSRMTTRARKDKTTKSSPTRSRPKHTVKTISKHPLVPHHCSPPTGDRNTHGVTSLTIPPQHPPTMVSTYIQIYAIY